MINTTYLRILLSFFLVTTVSILVAMLLNRNGSSCSLGSKVLKIGGCDSSGTCGVIYTDGHKSTLYYPVVGELCKAE